MDEQQIREFQEDIMKIHSRLTKVDPCPYIDHTLQSLEEAVMTLNEKRGMLGIDDLLSRLN